MSIIRLSVLGDGIYAPDSAGNLDYRDYSAQRGAGQRGTGKLGKIERPAMPDDSHPLARYLARSLAIEAANLPADKPVTIMVHGFQFDPAMTVVRPPHHHKADNPHARVYHFEPTDEVTEMRHHSTSWPVGLGYADGDAGAEGLCIAFGWYSNPGFFSSLFDHGLNFYAKAYLAAEDTAWYLAMVAEIVTRLLDRPVDIFCHSLGSRVVIRGLAQSAALAMPDTVVGTPTPQPVRDSLTAMLNRLDRVIILAGAEKVLEGQLMMQRLNLWQIADVPNRRAPHFYNIVSRENDVLDKLGENFGPTAAGSKQVVGHNGLEKRDPLWVDMQFDDPDVARWFNDRGFVISGDNDSSIFAVLDHWIHYTWRENMRVYTDMLRNRDAWKLGDLKVINAIPGGRIFDRVHLMRGPSSHAPWEVDLPGG
ncbi:hypothetical protein [Minwuia sp.]|uniref:hypothetical protein n=1 Tax=Minwuia sp. TaxID=2493630 RepID=UPI003A933AC3